MAQGSERKLVGRAAELEALAAVVGAATAGPGAAVALLGEAGIGKTRLLEELCGESERAGQVVLAGRAAELEREIPFAPFTDAIDDYLRSLNPRLFAPLGASRLAQLGPVLPALAELGEEPAPPGGSERYRTHRALRELLGLLAARRPLILTLDDVHWADEASQEMLAHLLRHPVEGPFLLAIALRREQSPPILINAIAAAVRDGALRPLEIGPLALEETVELLGEGIDAESARALHAEGGGNPLFCQELAAARPAATRSAPIGRDPRRGDPPPAVIAALSGEVRSLDDSTRALLEAAAVAGDPFEIELAAAAGEIAEAAALGAVDRLLERDLVRPTDAPRVFRFRHPVVWRAVYESSGAGWRIGAHRRCAEALAVRGSPVLSRAHHVERSAQVGDQEAAAVLAAAGRAAMPRSPAIAAHWLTAALRLLPADAGDATRLELTVANGMALGASGRLVESRDALERALGGSSSAAGEERVALVAYCASLENLLGLHDAARARLDREFAALPDESSPAAASLLIEAALGDLFQSNFDGMRERARRALEAATSCDEERLAAAAGAVLALGECYVGEIAAARASLETALGRASRLGDEQLAPRIDAPYHLGWALQWLERLEDAVEQFDRAIALSRTTGRGYLFVQMLIGKAYSLVSSGRLVEAAEAADAAVESARLAGNPVLPVWALWTRAWVAHWRGDLERAIADAEEATGLAREQEGSILHAAGGGWVLGAVRLDAGDAAGCAEAILDATGGPDLPRVEPGVKCLCYELLTEAELAQGRRPEAARWAERGEAVAAGLDLELPRVFAARASAAIALANGDLERAAALGATAATAAERVGAHLHADLSRLLTGRALAAAGRNEAAARQLEEAMSGFESCGARRGRDSAARELRKLGRRVRRPQPPGAASAPDALSGRQREVAELIAAGRTNREIAASLHLAEKTVEKHVSNLLAKLEVNRRAAVGAALAARPPGQAR